jgi:hypothetical protein
VQDLKDELELFAVVAGDAQTLFQRAEHDQVPLSADTPSRTLHRCLTIVEDIGGKLDEYAGRTTNGRKGWWMRMKAASRKKTLLGYLQRLERAKSQLVVLQANLTQ